MRALAALSAVALAAALVARASASVLNGVDLTNFQQEHGCDNKTVLIVRWGRAEATRSLPGLSWAPSCTSGAQTWYVLEVVSFPDCWPLTDLHSLSNLQAPQCA
jgi:hypothetical protein